MGITLWSGLTEGAIFALVAAGFQLSLIPSGVFNFAQGAIVVGGTFLTYLWLESIGMPFVAALALNLLCGIALGALAELVSVRPLRWRASAHDAGGPPVELVTTVGMSFALIGAYGLIWGYLPLKVPFAGPTGTVEFLGIRSNPVQIILVVGAIVVAVGLQLWFTRSRLGQACLAVAEDRDSATVRGINVNRLSIGAFAAAGALGTVSAMAIGPVTFATPEVANLLAVSGFVALAVGGEASFVGSLLGGFLIGIVSALAVRYIGNAYGDISLFLVLLLTLMLRPQGIGGEAQTRTV